ncbi:MAG: hypothetical protein ISR97_01090 [Nitrospira sp.]|nr:hypothetical protein [Nitrospira sp.]
MSSLLLILKRVFALLFKTVYIGFFFVFCILLLKMLYFPAVEQEKSVAVSEYERNSEMIEMILNKEKPVPRDHFHMTDETVFRLEPDPPLCLKCHGFYPHTKDVKKLSFLNLHVGIMACEVCHVRKDFKGSNHYFAWADLETGKKSMKVKGGYGKYDAKIVPIKEVKGVHERLDQLIDEKFHDFYSSLQETKYQPEHRDDLMKIHEYNLSKKAVICLDCHKKDGYLNFSTLGFSRNRINQLTSSEVSRMVEHYDTFYMPKMLRSQ